MISKAAVVNNSQRQVASDLATREPINGSERRCPRETRGVASNFEVGAWRNANTQRGSGAKMQGRPSAVMRPMQRVCGSGARTAVSTRSQPNLWRLPKGECSSGRACRDYAADLIHTAPCRFKSCRAHFTHLPKPERIAPQWTVQGSRVARAAQRSRTAWDHSVE